MDRYADQAVVYDSCVLVGLLRFNHSYKPDVYKTADMCGFVHKDQNIQRIAILTQGRWDETEIIKKSEPSGNRPPSLKISDSGS